MGNKHKFFSFDFELRLRLTFLEIVNSYQTDSYCFKTNNGNTRIKGEICSNPFEHISHIVLFSLLTLNKWMLTEKKYVVVTFQREYYQTWKKSGQINLPVSFLEHNLQMLSLPPHISVTLFYAIYNILELSPDFQCKFVIPPEAYIKGKESGYNMYELPRNKSKIHNKKTRMTCFSGFF